MDVPEAIATDLHRFATITQPPCIEKPIPFQIFSYLYSDFCFIKIRIKSNFYSTRLCHFDCFTAFLHYHDYKKMVRLESEIYSNMRIIVKKDFNIYSFRHLSTDKYLYFNIVSIRPTTGIKPLYTTIATVTMNLIVSAAIVLLNPYVTIYISYKIPPFALSVHIPDVSTSIYVEVDSKVLLGLPFCDKAFVR